MIATARTIVGNNVFEALVMASVSLVFSLIFEMQHACKFNTVGKYKGPPSPFVETFIVGIQQKLNSKVVFNTNRFSVELYGDNSTSWMRLVHYILKDYVKKACQSHRNSPILDV